MKKDARIGLRLSTKELEALREYAIAENESFSIVVRALIRDGLRFRAYLGGALEKIMIIGTTGVPAQDDIQSLARCVLEKIKGE